MKKLTIFFFILLLVPIPVLAEGNCPPGYYPIGGQGAAGCAPISSGQTSGVPQATGEWQTRWGAIAVDDAGLRIGVSSGESSKRAARKLAASRCTEGGGSGCKAIIDYKNGCIAMAGSAKANRSSSYQADSIKRAEQLAMEVCGKKYDDCKVIYSECSQANFRKYK
ncbi:DUF4189 domain-containing protein [Xanthomonas floridensis]|uniref:DUF4189 domain-containing protein n=1 Tax=Xanthomonas floridensis TaxID=1843580 RepID=A0ABU5PY97_9XANT|nr:DUF4189 domain-containing protein [Xanthomonas floridensis]MEA5124570.1 DUF4189 domain-containing protein [Xanthomonas floridensis]MEA5132165.1 DUF4189 domain-containing protein [Xanthomonas floridensis]